MLKFLKNPPVFLFFLFVIGVICFSAAHGFGREAEGPEHREFRLKVESWQARCDPKVDRPGAQTLICAMEFSELVDEGQRHGWIDRSLKTK